MRTRSPIRIKIQWLPLDRLILGITLISMLILTGLIGLEYWVPPQVQDFNWDHQQVTAHQRHLILTFNRAMDLDSVAQHLTLTPPLSGEARWLGKRLIYVLDEPAQYGQVYQVVLEGAQDRYGQVMPKAFKSEFQTPDPQVVVVGLTDAELGRLVLLNLTTQDRTVLTPPELKVTEFHPVREGQTLYFFGTQGTSQEQDLYQLTLSDQTLTRVLDHETYHNLKFQVSPDGSLLIVERINPQNPIQTEIWIRQQPSDSFKPISLGANLTGDFLITPDNSSLIMARGQGLAIIPLTPAVTETFLPEFGQILAIKSDGTAGAMIKFNPDFTRSLWIVNNVGSRQEILKTEGSILGGQFAPSGSIFYCLVTQLSLIDYTESPRLLAIDWEAGEQTELVTAEFPTELDFSVAPDGRQLLYTLLDPAPGALNPRAPLSRTGQAIATGQVELMDLKDRTQPIQSLEISAAAVKWVP